MKKRYAEIADGTVKNVFLYIPGRQLDGLVEVGADIGVGWAYDGETFTAPPEPEPEPLDPYRPLSPAKFARLKGYPVNDDQKETRRYRDVWTAIDGVLSNGGKYESLFLDLQEHAAAQSYRLGVTLAMLEQLEDTIEDVMPGTDVSPERIRKIWAEING